MKNPYNSPCFYCPMFIPWECLKEQGLIRTVQNNPLNVKGQEIRFQDSVISESLRIPEILGNADKRVLNQMNGSFKNDILEFKSQLEEAAKEGAETAKRLGKPFKPYSISNVYQLTYNKNNMVSLSILYNEIIDGRSSYIRVPYNYDVRSGEPISIKDLFKDGVQYKAAINKKIIEKLKAGTVAYPPATASNFKGIAEDQPFYLEGDNLVLFFSFNEIAPQAAEIPVVRIPLSDFRNLIKPQLLRG